jgi:hypothetical protein
LAAAQPKKPPKPPMAENVEMAEDLEVMGEVLRGHLRQLYAPYALLALPGGSNRLSEYCRTRNCFACHTGPLKLDDALKIHGLKSEAGLVGTLIVESGVERPEGMYLEGYGVVYQVRVDMPLPEEAPPEGAANVDADDSPARRPWDHAVRALRGQPPFEPPEADCEDAGPLVPTKSDLVDALVGALAENVGNFRHLQPEDRLTVAVTFPRSKRPAAGVSRNYMEMEEGYGEYGTGGAEYGEMEGYESEGYGSSSGGAGSYGSSSGYGRSGEEEGYASGYEEGGGYGGYGGYEGYEGGGYGGYADGSASSGSQEVSGDLYMRQKNYAKAIAAYRKAWAGESYAEGGGGKDVRRLLGKLAQAYLAAGDFEEAHKLIEKARAGESTAADDSAASEGPRAIPLPARLTVSIAKSYLDAVEQGSVARVDLIRGAVVHYLNPPPETPGLDAKRQSATSEEVFEYFSGFRR